MNNQRASFDLHLHTCFSYDAVVEPRVYLEAARANKMRAIAITDHHGFDVCLELQDLTSEFFDISLIPGAELGVKTSHGFVDILCLNLPYNLPDELKAVFSRSNRLLKEYGAGMCHGMQAMGLDYTPVHQEKLLVSYRPTRVMEVQGMTRVKSEILRDYFIERGFVEDEETYKKLLKEIRDGGYLPDYPGVSEVVNAVKAAGALVVLAHPHDYFQGAEQPLMDCLREECQLDGIECAHHKIPPEFTPVYRDYCLRHKLVSTAGSDSHMPGDIDTLFGRHLGEEYWLDELLERING